MIETTKPERIVLTLFALPLLIMMFAIAARCVWPSDSPTFHLADCQPSVDTGYDIQCNIKVGR